MNTLTKKEQRSLAELEETVERGLETFVEVGRALMEIRDRRLYREQYDTFETYCRERWGWSRRRGYQLMAAAETVENIEANVNSSSHAPPKNEAVTRPLTKLPDDEQAEAWQEAVDTAPEKNGEKQVTAKHVQQVVRDRVEKDDREGVSGQRAGGGDTRTLEAIIREGMAYDVTQSHEVAKDLPISKEVFQAGRYILMLADDPDLSDENRARVEKAVDYMNRHRQVAYPRDSLSDLIEMKFGGANNRRAGVDRAPERLRQQFMRSYAAITQSCKSARSVDVPLLPHEDGAEILEEIESAIEALEEFHRRVKEAVQ